MKIYRVEFCRVTRIYKLVGYDVVKTTATNYLCAGEFSPATFRIPRNDKNAYLDERAGFGALAKTLEAHYARLLEDATSALKAIEVAHAGVRGEVTTRGWMRPEHVEAIREFARRHGNGWKEELARQWMSGADAANPNGHLLRQARNQGGPSWLNRYELP